MLARFNQPIPNIITRPDAPLAQGLTLHEKWHQNANSLTEAELVKLKQYLLETCEQQAKAYHDFLTQLAQLSGEPVTQAIYERLDKKLAAALKNPTQYMSGCDATEASDIVGMMADGVTDVNNPWILLLRYQVMKTMENQTMADLAQIDAFIDSKRKEAASKPARASAVGCFKPASGSGRYVLTIHGESEDNQNESPGCGCLIM